jgi:hypothetical protein
MPQKVVNKSICAIYGHPAGRQICINQAARSIALPVVCKVEENIIIFKKQRNNSEY